MTEAMDFNDRDGDSLDEALDALDDAIDIMTDSLEEEAVSGVLFCKGIDVEI